MPTLWTPDGERNVERESPTPPTEPVGAPTEASKAPAGASGAADGSPLSASELKAQAEQLGIDLDSLSPEERAQAEAAVAEMAETRARLAETPASEVIANHLMGFYELGAIHLSRQPPAFEDAALAIDALPGRTRAGGRPPWRGRPGAQPGTEPNSDGLRAGEGSIRSRRCR